MKVKVFIAIIVDMIAIYTDGACSGNNGNSCPGGWGVVIDSPDGRRELYGGAAGVTNNKMELVAVIEALRAIPIGSQAEVLTDSQYVQRGISTWIHAWKKRGWKNANNKPVANQDLWQALDSLDSERRIRWVWIKGHNGHPG
ncbi:MAG: ribonuclease HI, partial [Rickettsiales bacterium]|nr:ribonuclease HI [Rickettsiales bacterium]